MLSADALQLFALAFHKTPSHGLNQSFLNDVVDTMRFVTQTSVTRKIAIEFHFVTKN